MRTLLLLIPLCLLAYPFAEIAASIWLFHLIGFWLFAWFFLAGWIGVVMLRNWRLAAAWAVVGAARAGEMPFSRLLYALRSMIAAVLLVIPGPIGDCIALLLLLPWPVQSKTVQAQAASDIIEGEFTEIIRETNKIESK
ncbi:FxsA family protein [Burkholderiaceae bacterium DAT-1]|nr:FxsA family protein [Burkholderiaceae bacterium DAT-1]